MIDPETSKPAVGASDGRPEGPLHRSRPDLSVSDLHGLEGDRRLPSEVASEAAFEVLSEFPSGLPSDSLEGLASSPIGAYLRRQRILRDVSIDELASITRIPLRSLERLEGGEFDGETDGFVRGFVRTVALALGLDADDTLARMLQEPALGVWERHQSSRRVKQALVALVLAVILVVGFLVLQAGWRVFVGATSNDPTRELVLWRDPVRSLAEETGVEVDPAGEIDPRSGLRGDTGAGGRAGELERSNVFDPDETAAREKPVTAALAP
jgi:hypothetical protein